LQNGISIIGIPFCLLETFNPKSMKKNKLIVSVILLFTTMAFNTSAQYKYDYLYEHLPFNMPKVLCPVFRETTISITDCGGVGDGKLLNTSAFERGMQLLSEKGGGTLRIPFGVWYTGPIVFRSDINLHLDKGAVILFTTDLNAYPLVKTSFEGQEGYRCQSPISGRDLKNIAITGDGAINGSGQAWRPLKKGKVTEDFWKSVVHSGGVLKTNDYWFPNQESLDAEIMRETQKDFTFNKLSLSQTEPIKNYFRPVMISLIECKNIYLQGVLFENSPNWNIHPLMCENMIVDGITIRNPEYAQNGDAIDIESCKNVLFLNSTVDAGDDCICLKSGKDLDGRLRARPTENVIVDNCKVFKGHGGFVVGSEMSGGIRNVSVSNCVFMGTDVGLRFKSGRGRGGIVENIYIDRISMFDIATDSFLFDLYYGGKSVSETPSDGESDGPAKNRNPPVTEGTPIFRNIYVANLVSRNARRAMFFNGLPEMNITNIHVKNTVVTSRFGAELVESDGVTFQNVNIIPKKGAALVLNNVKNFKAENFIYPSTLTQPVEITGVDSKSIEINSKKSISSVSW